MANTLYDLVVNITANTASLVDGMSAAARSVAQTGAQMSGAMNGAQAAVEKVAGALKALGAIGAVSFVGHELVAVGESAVRAASDLNSLSSITGSSVESLSKLANQAKVAGADFTTFQAAIGGLTKALGTSTETNSDAVRALQYLGVTAKEPAKAMDQLVTAFARYEGGAGKAALATALFRNNGQEFLKTLDNMAKLGDVHATVTAKQAEEAEKLETQIRLLRSESNSFANVVLSDIVPALNSWITQFKTLREVGGAWYAFLNANTNNNGILLQIKTTQAAIDGLKEKIKETGDAKGILGKDPVQIGLLKSLNAQLDDSQKKLEGWMRIRDLAFGVGDPTNSDVRDIQAGTGKFAAGKGGQADFALKDTGAAASALKSILDSARKALIDSQIALADVGKTAEQVTTPAMKHLIELQQDPSFLALPKAIQDQVSALLKQADANLTLVATATARKKTEDDHWEMLKKQREAETALEAAIDARAEAQYQASLIRGGQDLAASVTALTDSIKAEEDRARAIGRTRVELVDMALAQERANLAIISQTVEIDPASIKAIELRIDALQRLRGAVGATDQLQAAHDGWTQLFEDIGRSAQNFLVDFAEHGSSAFKNLWNNFKHWALEALAAIAGKQIVVSIAGALGLTGAAGSALANTLGAGPAGGGFLGAASNGVSLYNSASSLYGTVGTIGAAYSAGYAGANAAAITYGAGAAAEVGSAAAGAVEAGGVLAGLEAGLAAVPVAGWVALAAVVVYSIISGMKNIPADRVAQFGSNAGLGAGNPLFRSQSALGSFGVFNDKWFSDADQGESVGKFLAGLTSIDNALASMVGPDTIARIQDRLATVTTTFSAGIEHEATQFGSILADRYRAVLDAIDPELGALANAFEGTGEQFAKFVVDVVGVFETLKTIDTESLFGQAVSATDIVALTQAGKSVGDTFKNLIQVFTLTDQIAIIFGRDINEAFGAIGLAGTAARQQLVDLLGGTNQAGAAVQNYLQTAFTDTQRNSLLAAQGMSTLSSVFAGIGRTVPETWGELNTLIDSFGTTTEEGRTLTALFLTRVVPAFAAVNGSAQEMADALNRAHESASSFFAQNFLSSDERNQNNLNAVADATGRFSEQLQALLGAGGIPTTTAGFHDFIIALQQTGTAGSQLADTIINDVGQAIVDLNHSTGTLANSANAAADAITNMNQAITTPAGQAQPAVDLVQAQLDLIGNVTKDVGARLTAQLGFLGSRIRDQDAALAQALPGSSEANRINATLNSLRATNAGLAADLAQYVSLRAQYGAEQAGQLLDLQHWHDANLSLFDRTPDELASFETLFHQQWQAILNGTADDLSKFFDRIHDYVRQLTTSDLSPLSPTEKFAEAQGQFRSDILLAQAGNADALGRITSEADTYLRAARDVFASGGETTAAFNEVVDSLTGLDSGTGTNVNATIAAAMPAGSTVLSQSDGQQISADITGELSDLRATVAALLDRLSGDSQDIVDAVKSAERAINNQAALTARA